MFATTAITRTPALGCAFFARDYAHYQEQLKRRQADNDAFDEEFGLPKTDLAWAKAMLRAQQRAMPRVDPVKVFREGLERRRYALAVGL